MHHNTAHYRLRRIEERTGRNPRRIADLLELLVALAIRDGDREDGEPVSGIVETTGTQTPRQHPDGQAKSRLPEADAERTAPCGTPC
ncbi:helix-turn-helix domain-containing protein [Streptomyces sp. F001]|uniref:helix-turn-helix domain-containing protein n=1 Tax=Streptomyces sp. F001 TaxID=1510026 RepID=UPI0013EEDE97|nr:helix-turn-helix domain-containing protein [Streptomyces sp. F001]